MRISLKRLLGIISASVASLVAVVSGGANMPTTPGSLSESDTPVSNAGSNNVLSDRTITLQAMLGEEFFSRSIVISQQAQPEKRWQEAQSGQSPPPPPTRGPATGSSPPSPPPPPR